MILIFLSMSFMNAVSARRDQNCIRKEGFHGFYTSGHRGAAPYRTTVEFSGGRLIGLASKVRRHGQCTRPRLLAERVTLECELTLDGVSVSYNGSYRAPGKDGKMQNISVELIVLNTYAVVRVTSKEDGTPVLNNFRIPKMNLKLKDTGFDFAQSDNVRQTLRRSVQSKLSSVLFRKFRKTLEEALQSVLVPIA
ncbi:uncharacterized protein LOC135378718 isoform X2 [Ornithodoros turicata]|uniref:uncharacterized protein LOC135378718 isoform X2 n=1 Tax=Ornithodoros turicata TaxID=34597 RepID=UPI003138BCB0